METAGDSCPWISLPTLARCPPSWAVEASTGFMHIYQILMTCPACQNLHPGQFDSWCEGSVGKWLVHCGWLSPPPLFTAGQVQALPNIYINEIVPSTVPALTAGSVLLN